MESLASSVNGWENLMKSYLRKLFGLYRLEKLEAPQEIIEMRRTSIREAWERLVLAVKKDFQPRLIDSKTRESLEARFRSCANEIVFEDLSIKAIPVVRPCESCRHYKDVESDDDITDVGINPDIRTSDLIRDRCRTTPHLYPATVKAGGFTIFVDGCESFEPHPRLYEQQAVAITTEEIKSKALSDLEQDAKDFDVWVSQLKFAESLLD